MLKQYIHISFLFFLMVALSGVYMRIYPWIVHSTIPYDHLLHAHSHLALLGWEFLAAFILFLAICWKHIITKKQAIAICFSLVLVSILMFFAFLYQGYSVFSIIMSTLHIFIEYWVAVFVYKLIKTMKKGYRIAAIYINGALIALVISSIGPYALAFISANGWKEYAAFDMSVYFYLHFQYNGWLTLFLIGIFLLILQVKRIQFNERLLYLGFWIYFISLFPSYLLSVLWVEQFGVGVHIIGSIGSIGQWIGVIIIIFAIKKSIVSFKRHFSKLIRVSLFLTFLLLLLKSTMELGLISPSLAELVYDTRSIIIGYLHLTLLGFISIFILAQFLMIGFLSSNKLTSTSFTIFLIGFIFTELLLFIQGLWGWIGLSTIPFYNEGLLIASILLAIGVLVLWLSIKQGKPYLE